jgi:hypothetical protein
MRHVTSASPFYNIIIHLIHFVYSHRYDHSFQALSHVLLLTPQNPFYVLQAAETAYTSEDFSLAIKIFLTVVDMTDADDSEQLLQESTPLGITVRAWFGVKLVRSFLSRRLLIELNINAILKKTVCSSDSTECDPEVFVEYQCTEEPGVTRRASHGASSSCVLKFGSEG